MTDQARESELKRRDAFRFLGIDPNVLRLFAGQVHFAGREADLLSLPVDTTHQEPLQDPTTGDFYFMPGVSDPGGDDILI